MDRVTLVVLASTERESLKKTVQLLSEHCRSEDIYEMIIFLISSNCPSAEVAEAIARNSGTPFPVRCCVQQTPGLSPAVYEIPRLISSNCTHFLIIASDLEMDPLTVPKLIETGKEHPDAIVCASKFQKGAHRTNYGGIHYICNRTVNAVVERLLHIKGTELISTFQLYPLQLWREMHFTNPDRAFYEFTIRPLAAGVPYIEIPTGYVRRSEGASNFSPRKYIDLGVTFIRTALDERRRIIKERRKKTEESS